MSGTLYTQSTARTPSYLDIHRTSVLQREKMTVVVRRLISVAGTAVAFADAGSVNLTPSVCTLRDIEFTDGLLFTNMLQ